VFFLAGKEGNHSSPAKPGKKKGEGERKSRKYVERTRNRILHASAGRKKERITPISEKEATRPLGGEKAQLRLREGRMGAKDNNQKRKEAYLRIDAPRL